jgi:hypothetical protein
MNKTLFLCIFFTLAIATSLLSQEQSRESMAVDATAAQWSYQFAYEGFFDYDTANGRPEGNKGFLQFRMVAPVPKSESVPFTILPRLTLRLNQNSAGDYGFGSSDLFALIIAQQWSTGRWGVGPQINFPAAEGFGNTNWGYGLAAAITERAMNDDLFLALLLQQTWANDAAGVNRAAPLGINLILVYQLGDGWYIGNGDFVISYNWQDSAFRVPFGIRLGKAFIDPGTTWNLYVEYATGLYYDEWRGSVPNHAVRVNGQFQIPIGL